MQIDTMDTTSLAGLEAELENHYASLCAEGLDLDLTRGKPAGDQLALSATLDGALGGDYRTEDGADTRGYGGQRRHRGSAQARRRVAWGSPRTRSWPAATAAASP